MSDRSIIILMRGFRAAPWALSAMLKFTGVRADVQIVVRDVERGGRGDSSL